MTQYSQHSHYDTLVYRFLSSVAQVTHEYRHHTLRTSQHGHQCRTAIALATQSSTNPKFAIRKRRIGHQQLGYSCQTKQAANGTE